MGFFLCGQYDGWERRRTDVWFQLSSVVAGKCHPPFGRAEVTIAALRLSLKDESKYGGAQRPGPRGAADINGALLGLACYLGGRWVSGDR